MKMLNRQTLLEAIADGDIVIWEKDENLLRDDVLDHWVEELMYANKEFEKAEMDCE